MLVGTSQTRLKKNGNRATFNMTEDALLINYPPLTDIGEIRAPNRSAGLILWGGGVS